MSTKRRLIVDIKQWGVRREWGVSLQSENASMSIWSFGSDDVGEAKARMYGRILAEMVGAEIGDGSLLLLWPKLAEALGINTEPPFAEVKEDKTNN